MKTYALVLLVALGAILPASCKTIERQASAIPINPGEAIGKYQVRTHQGGEVRYGWELDTECVHGEGKRVNTCELPVGVWVNISVGIYDDSPSKTLDELWSEQTYIMMIDGRHVNLEAFGHIESDHPLAGVIRYWDVVITASKPVEVVVSSNGTVSGEAFEDTTTYVFSGP